MKKKVRKHVGGLEPDKYLSDEQLKTLIQYLRDNAKNKRGSVNLFIVQMLLFSGLRSAELLALKLRDLPHCHGKSVILVRSGKGNVSRTVLIPDILNVPIDVFIRDHRSGAKPGSFLFTAEGKSTPMLYDSLYCRLRLIGQRSGIGLLHPHQCRHTYAVTLYNVAGDVLFVQQQLGHANVETTGIYAKTNPQSGRKQVESLPCFGQEFIKPQDNTGKLDVSKLLGI